jgi:hypothetical protein
MHLVVLNELSKVGVNNEFAVKPLSMDVQIIYRLVAHAGTTTTTAPNAILYYCFASQHKVMDSINHDGTQDASRQTQYTEPTTA